MLVNDKIAKKFALLTLDLSVKTAMEAHNYLKTHKKINGYYKYPIRQVVFPKGDPKYTELIDKIPFLSFDIPKYEMKDFPKDLVQYSAIFRGYEKDCIDCSVIGGFDELFDFINSNEELKKMFTNSIEESVQRSMIKNFITEIVERYLHVSKADCNIPADLEEQLKPYVSEKIIRYISDKLYIDILIPICLVTFEEDIIQLSDRIEIKKIPNDIQKARQQACTYESSNEDWVAACATHMIVLHNYCFTNSENLSISKMTHDYNAYPIQEIDNVISTIKVVTGYSLGYAQILSFPLDWITDFCADLVPLYGAKSHFINSKETEKFWMNINIKVISKEQSSKIQEMYKNVLLCNKGCNQRRLSFALNRFNRCTLRNEVDDMTTDAAIGLEALLADGTKGEITYTIANRICVVFAHQKNSVYTTLNCREIMKEIYNYRSAIVHGRALKDKEKYYIIDDKKFEVPRIAVDFLRYSILFLTENQDYFESRKFDEYIDKAMVK